MLFLAGFHVHYTFCGEEAKTVVNRISDFKNNLAGDGHCGTRSDRCFDHTSLLLLTLPVVSVRHSATLPIPGEKEEETENVPLSFLSFLLLINTCMSVTCWTSQRVSQGSQRGLIDYSCLIMHDDGYLFSFRQLQWMMPVPCFL